MDKHDSTTYLCYIFQYEDEEEGHDDEIKNYACDFGSIYLEYRPPEPQICRRPRMHPGDKL